MGSSITCFCSTEFSVDITRDGKRYRQTFTDGGLKISKPSITKTATHSGTTVNFQLDSSVFVKDRHGSVMEAMLPDTLIENRAKEIALTNPTITTEFNKKKFKFRKGFDDVIKHVSNDYFKFETTNMEFYVLFDVVEGLDEKVFTWVNSSMLFDGGICNTQFINAFTDATVKHLTNQAKKLKCEVTKHDVKKNLLVIGNLKVSDPEYDAQSKTRLTGPNLRKELGQLVTEQWTAFARKNKDWLSVVLDRAVNRHHQQANKAAVSDHKKNLKKKVEGLKDATSKNRFETMLLVTEGLSASAMIVQVRDPKIHASLPLTGKINNVYGSTVAQLLKMGKVADLISAIGLVPGQPVDRVKLNYGKVIIATDADYDGDDIMTLLTCLIHQFWPTLLDPDYEPFLYRLVAPNVVASKGKKRIHYATKDMYQKAKTKLKGYTIEYMKGLGSMSSEDYAEILSSDDYLIPIISDDKMDEVMELLFGSNADKRKEWLRT